MREIFVEENVPIGHELARFFAVDEDSGKNGEIHYFLKNNISNNGSNILFQFNDLIFSNIKEIFNLDETGGILTTKVVLDRETRDHYRFQVFF